MDPITYEFQNFNPNMLVKGAFGIKIVFIPGA